VCVRDFVAQEHDCAQYCPCGGGGVAQQRHANVLWLACCTLSSQDRHAARWHVRWFCAAKACKRLVASMLHAVVTG